MVVEIVTLTFDKNGGGEVKFPKIVEKRIIGFAPVRNVPKASNGRDVISDDIFKACKLTLQEGSVVKMNKVPLPFFLPTSNERFYPFASTGLNCESSLVKYDGSLADVIDKAVEFVFVFE